MLLRKVKRFTGTKKKASYDIVLQYSVSKDILGRHSWVDFPQDKDAEWEYEMDMINYKKALETEQRNSWR